MGLIGNFLATKEKEIIIQSNNAVNILDEEWNYFLTQDTYLKEKNALRLLDIIKNVDRTHIIPWYFFWNKRLHNKLKSNYKFLDDFLKEINGFNIKYGDYVRQNCDSKERKILNIFAEMTTTFNTIISNLDFENYNDQNQKIEEAKKLLDEIALINKKYSDIYNVSLDFVNVVIEKLKNDSKFFYEQNNTFMWYKELLNDSKEEIHNLEDIYNTLIKEDKYLVFSAKKQLLSIIDDAINIIESHKKNKKIVHNEINIILDKYVKKAYDYLQLVDDFNSLFIIQKKEKYKDLFKRKNLILNDEQQTAIITDDTHNIVVAGAGSGKTEVLTTRIAYLIQRTSDPIHPKRILALAFQNKASNEIQERIKRRYGLDVEIRTFHSLGKKIIDDAAKNLNIEPPKLKIECSEDWNFKHYIKKIFDDEISKNKQLQNEIINFMRQYGDDKIIKSKDDFAEKEEFYKYQRNLQYTTLDGSKVKSESERDIMNFFLSHKLNGNKIRIMYEHQAEWMKYIDDEGEEHIPQPDFYFPDFDIYLEHWAINKNGNVPEWFSGEDPTKEYKKNMEIKKEKYYLHKKTLIETSQAQIEDGTLFTVLKERFIEKLQEKNSNQLFELTPLTYHELIEQVWTECKEFIYTISTYISRFIVIAKTYRLYPIDIINRLNNETWSPKQYNFAKIANIIYIRYQSELALGNFIDFSDMINLAADYLKEYPDLFRNKYDHILIDEYQDISTQRYELIKELMNKNDPCKLFCVGDDWQSIMGFSGSNLDFFINFAKYFPNPARTDLTKNYRSIKSIVDAGSCIIKNNEKGQLDKHIVSISNETRPIQVYSSKHKKEYHRSYYEQIAKHCLDKIKEYHIEKNYRYDDFMILLRITKKPPLINFIYEYAEKIGLSLSENADRPGCVHLLSVHKSKGLQANVVFLLNVDNDLYGFPCQLDTPDIFEITIKNNDGLREQEERRLFYVAVTRAKEEVIMYTQKYHESKFITEIKDFIKREELGY